MFTLLVSKSILNMTNNSLHLIHVMCKTLETTTKIYSELLEDKPHICAIHAGLECGVIGEKVKGMDMVSFGPTIKGPHSPDERVEIKSVDKFVDTRNNYL